MQRLVGMSCVVVLVASCASTPRSSPPSPERLARADAELAQGCYDCLLAAQKEYRALGAGAVGWTIASRLFEVDLLLMLREKELDLPPSDAVAEARRLATDLPPALGAARYLALIDILPGNPPGGSRHGAFSALTARVRYMPSPAERDEIRAWLLRDGLRAEVRRYFRVALDCSFPTPATSPPVPATASSAQAAAAPTTAAPTAPAGPPLVAYRQATCIPGSLTELAAVRAREPRFVEVSLFLAAAELGAAALGAGPGQAHDHLAAFLARFPASAAAHNLAGEHGMLVADPAGALQHYERALGLEPDHEQAALGRVIALTNLGRHDEAIEAATRLIALEDQSSANAYYWRASNHHALHHLADARRDITAARNLIATSDILQLAGVIEYEQSDLDPAEADLTEAIRIAGECTARWYLSLVLRQRKQWLPAGHAFQNAMSCYRDRSMETASRLAILLARSDVDPTYRERTAASLAASIDADTRQQHLSALMAASHLVAGGDATAARPLVDIAGEDPALADQVTQLRTRLAGSPRTR